MKKTAAIVVFVAFMFAAVAGWFMNLAKLLGAQEIAGLEIARGIGILVAPLGAILGWV